MTIDVNQLVSDMQSAASNVLGKDVTSIRGFTQSQLQAIAQQSAFVAGGILDGSITDDTREHFLDSIEEMTRSFVNCLSGMISVTAEKVWNAMVNVLWATISKATGLALVAP